MKYLISWLFLMHCVLVNGQDAKDYEVSSIGKFVYNESGLRTEKLSFDAHNILTKRVVYSYDDKGNKIKTEKYLADGTLLATYEYEFNAQNQKVVSQKTDWVKSSKSGKVYRYNSLGQNIETEYDNNGQLTKRVYYKYNKNGDQTEYKESNGKNEQLVLFFTENKYDATGRLIEKYKRNDDEELVKSNAYSYNSNSQLVESFASYKTGRRGDSKHTYSYDKEGRAMGFVKYIKKGLEH
ncbi:hypothetical protein [Labilibaculum filiforme]|nr:hypothetical protein [Labilibaculum filiforme]